VTRTTTRFPRVAAPGTSAVPRPGTLQWNGTGFAPGIAAVTVPVTLGLEGRHAITTRSPRAVAVALTAVAETGRASGAATTMNVRCAALPAASWTITVTWNVPARELAWRTDAPRSLVPSP
jgi:hypothetical protein